jgi:uncharacterized damage-inducible protein DinB
MTDLRYPVGKFEQAKGSLSPEERRQKIDTIAAMPSAFRAAVAGLDAGQLDTPYREGGWTVRQVVHHVPDSHMNAYMRIKFALTEEEPMVKAYDEARWAELPDVGATPVETSLALLDNLHGRWVALLRSLSADEFSRNLRHPEHGLIDIDRLLGLYAWHGRHHTAHITSLRERSGW